MKIPMVFLDGPWRLAMGLNALETADWLWFDGEAEAELAQKRQLHATRPSEVYAVLPRGEPAAREVLALLIEHLSRHHPDRFAADGEGLRVLATGERVGADAPDPLLHAGFLVQEDLCLMARQADGAYALVGASLCFPMRWRLADKIGRPMHEIHTPVPGFAKRLGPPVDRYFQAITVERPAWRANWSLTDEPALFQPDTRTKPMVVSAEDAGERLWLRVERQTMRRLAESGQVLFTIRTIVRRLGEVARAEGVAAAMAARMREMPEPMLRYKNILTIREPLLAWLDRQAVGASELGPPAG